MLAGYMRYLGFPARWLGTGTEKGPAEWDANNNGLLDAAEKAPVSSGHRYSQVWLGSHYGWICFDATPTRPPFDDFDPEPPLQPQWRFMNRAAAGHLKDKRVVFNVGSGLFRPLYREFEYDEKLAIDNNCGGDQRYNLQGRFDKPALWKLARQRIFVENVCYIPSVEVSGPRGETLISWKLEGYWDKDPTAKLNVYLQKLEPESDKPEKTSALAENIAPEAGNISVDLSRFEGGSYRILINKVGDSETGVVVDFGECLSPPIHVLTLQFFCQGYEQLSRACCPWWFENLDAVSCGEAITWWGDFGSLTDGLSCHPFEAPHSPTPADSATGVPLTQLFYWSAGPEPVGCELGDVYVFMFSWGTGPENMTTLFDWGPGAYIPEGMLPNTRYYWQVASSSYNGAGPYWGPLWTFTTWGATPVETSTWGRIKALYE